MKNIFTLFIIISFLGYSNTTFAQADDNSRTAAQLAKKQAVTPTPLTATPRNSGDDDGDEGQYEETDQTTVDVAEMAKKIVDMEGMIQLLQLQNEQLSAEILAVNRKSDLCCNSSLKFTPTGGYLLQNAPNPFYGNSSINYVLPENYGIAQIDIRTLDGKIMKTFPVNQQGEGMIDVDNTNLEPNTYVYSLTIDGLVVDSKIMVLTN